MVISSIFPDVSNVATYLVLGGGSLRNHIASTAKNKIVAIVVPLSMRAELTPDEEISLRHLRHFLGQYDKYVIIPKSLNLSYSYPDFSIVRFPDKFFGSAKAHNELHVSERFFKQFNEYKYILMYHLDALVLSDQLLAWCEAGFDYIGAPWLHCEDSPWVTHPRVGNAGFALYNIQNVLNVFNSDRYAEDPYEYWNRVYASEPWIIRAAVLPKKYLKRLLYFNGARWEMARWSSRAGYRSNTDFFWADEAIKYYDQFRIPSVEVGLRFAFEVAPRLCFELNNHQLPFGCHAWPRYDRAFWEPYLLK